jgi:23S rRNA (uracil1939-C5)-methyltransferase
MAKNKAAAVASTGIIESLDHAGQGIAREGGKTIFVEGGLPGEQVSWLSYRRKPNFEMARVTAIHKAASARVTPRCPHFGVCGGCSLQHADPVLQIATKQRVLEDNLQHIGNVKPGAVYAPVSGPTWHYRFRARVSVRLVPKKGGVLVGFHERRSSYIADMTSCSILPRQMSDLLVPLRHLIEGMSQPDRMPQIEMAVGETPGQPSVLDIVLVLRHLESLTETDQAQLAAFGKQHGVRWFLQPGGPATVHPLNPQDAPLLTYHLPNFGLSLNFAPTEFTQVNPAINHALVTKAMRLLAAQPGERVADMFCGLGNFTLPIARSGAEVIGVEGSEALVSRAAENAANNGLGQLTGFFAANLFLDCLPIMARLGKLDRMLIDPPREGALELVKALPDAEQPRGDAPHTIVYVSCNPATLARDAGILVNVKGYVLEGAGIANMFPHTAHVESIAVFRRP